MYHHLAPGSISINPICCNLFHKFGYCRAKFEFDNLFDTTIINSLARLFDGRPCIMYKIRTLGRLYPVQYHDVERCFMLSWLLLRWAVSVALVGFTRRRRVPACLPPHTHIPGARYVRTWYWSYQVQRFPSGTCLPVTAYARSRTWIILNGRKLVPAQKWQDLWRTVQLQRDTRINTHNIRAINTNIEEKLMGEKKGQSEKKRNASSKSCTQAIWTGGRFYFFFGEKVIALHAVHARVRACSNGAF